VLELEIIEDEYLEELAKANWGLRVLKEPGSACLPS